MPGSSDSNAALIARSSEQMKVLLEELEAGIGSDPAARTKFEAARDIATRIVQFVVLGAARAARAMEIEQEAAALAEELEAEVDEHDESTTAPTNESDDVEGGEGPGWEDDGETHDGEARDGRQPMEFDGDSEDDDSEDD